MSCLSRNSVETARAVYAHALTVFPSKKGIWIAASELAKGEAYGSSLDSQLGR